MKYYIRLLILLMVSPFRKSVLPTGPCVTPFHVWPNDLDVFMHMNNGAYLTIMDLARTDMMMRSGLVKKAAKRRWYPVVAAETIRFKRSLKLFLVELMDIKEPSPPMPDWIADWQRAQPAMNDIKHIRE